MGVILGLLWVGSLTPVWAENTAMPAKASAAIVASNPAALENSGPRCACHLSGPVERLQARLRTSKRPKAQEQSHHASNKEEGS